jgi:hypothetical protein
MLQSAWAENSKTENPKSVANIQQTYSKHTAKEHLNKNILNLITFEKHESI